MITQVKRQDHYAELFLRSLDNNDQPEWLKALRSNAFDYFLINGFPSVEDEEWKYTSTAPIVREKFELAENAAEIPSITDFLISESKESCIVFFNGQFIKEASNLSALKDIKVLSFSEALDGSVSEKFIRENLANHVNYNKNGFTALNTAFIDEALFLLIPANYRLEVPIQLLFLATQEKVVFPRVLIAAEKQSCLTLIESYSGFESEKYFTNSVIEVTLSEGAELKHYRIQRESSEAFHITNTSIQISKNATYDSTNITLGAKWSRHDIVTNFRGEGGQAFVDGLYMVSGEQHTDTHSVIDHRFAYCTSRQNYKGIIDGKSRAVFNGKVFVRENARGTDAHQSNKNLLLSNEARVDTKPQLEIFNDDVRCSHGATVGQLEDEEIFYLLSRGINPMLARNLLTYGFAEEIINKITVDSVKQMLDETLLNRLSAKL